MAKKELKKLTDFPTNRENPFLQQAIEEVDKHIVHKWKNTVGSDKKAISLVVSPDTGEVVGQTTFMRQIEVDDDKFTKLYLNQFQQFFDLTTAGIRVFGYIMTCMKPRTDMIFFKLKDCMEYTKYVSKVSVYKGLTELVQAGIIARGDTDYLYFVNPLIIWNGDRARFVTEYVKKSRKKKLEDPNQLTLDFKDE